MVLKLSGVEPTLNPPVVITKNAQTDSNSGKLLLTGEVINTGDADKVKAGFQYREYAGFVEELYSEGWKETGTVETASGEFEMRLPIKKEGKTYQYRAFVQHPKIRVYGDVLRVTY